MAKSSSCVCAFRFSNKPDDILIKTYLHKRAELGLKGSGYLQALVAMAYDGKPLPVIARLHPDKGIEGYAMQRFTILMDNPRYAELRALDTRTRNRLLLLTLKSVIVEAGAGEEEWMMPEMELERLNIRYYESGQGGSTDSATNDFFGTTRQITDQSIDRENVVADVTDPVEPDNPVAQEKKEVQQERVAKKQGGNHFFSNFGGWDNS